MEEIILKKDLELIKELTSRTFSGNTLKSNSTEEERDNLKKLKLKLKSLAEHFKKKYDKDYGLFESCVTSGNDIAIGGTRLGRVWSGIFKGSKNKQYAAQISFVINPESLALDIGFYFGRASGRGKSENLEELKNNFKNLGKILAKELDTDAKFKARYNSLFEYGFKASSANGLIEPDKWIDIINENPEVSQITIRAHPNDDGYINPATIELYVSMAIFLMAPIPSLGKWEKGSSQKRIIKPLTPEQRGEQAKRRTIIGAMGESIVLKEEIKKMKSFGLSKEKIPTQVSKDSDSYGYDILSYDKNGDDLFIEVKATTLSMENECSSVFPISLKEYNFYLKNKEKYRLIRVYDVEGSPKMVNVNMDNIKLSPNGYIVEIR